MGYLTLLNLLRLILLIACGLVMLPNLAQAQSDDAYDSAIEFDPEKLSSFSNRALVSLLSTESLILNRSKSYRQAVVDELVRRKASDALLDAFDTTNDWSQLKWIEVTLSRLRDPDVDSLMRRHAEGMWEGQYIGKAYLAALYLAKQGKCFGLEQLNRHYGELPISSLERAQVATLFGKYKYYPAAENLTQTIYTMVLNLGDASLEALTAMYPEAQPDVTAGPTDGYLGSLQDYWEKYVAAHPQVSSGTCHAQ